MRIRTRIGVLLSVAALALSVVTPAMADGDHPGLTPESVELVLFPGQHQDVRKVVHVPEIPPDADVYFLVDTTGSMTTVIAGIQATIGTIIPAIQAAAPTAQFGLGEYRDFPFDAFAFNPRVALGPDDGAGGGFDVSDDVAALVAAGGSDGSEAQFFALDQLASAGNVAGFNPATPSIVVWIGDAPAHDPVCTAISGLGYDITEAGVTAKLGATGWGGSLSVVAISTTTGFPSALDDDPTTSAGDYVPACGAPGGASGQATRIAAATGGTHLSGVGPGEIADAVLSAVGSVVVEVSMDSGCEWPITTTFFPESQDVVSGGHAVFRERISVAADAPGGTYVCRDVAYIDGNLLRDGRGQTIYETKTVLVPEGFLTGGGQIGKGSKGQQFGGNVGYLADGTIVGQWQFSDGASKLKMHSTGWTSLQFLVDPPLDSPPPDANANVAVFSGTSRVKIGKGPWDDSCWFTAYAADHGEPGKGADIYGIELDCVDEYTGGPWLFGRETIDAGNLQIHSGLKG